MTLGDRIKQARGDLSQNDFGDRLGVSRKTIIRYETEERPPDTNFVISLCREFKINPTWLITGAEPMHLSQPAPATLDRATRSLANPPPDQPKKTPSISEMITKMVAVLESETIFAAALAANIEAFHKAVVSESQPQTTDRLLATTILGLQTKNKELEQRLADMENEIKELDAQEGYEESG